VPCLGQSDLFSPAVYSRHSWQVEAERYRLLRVGIVKEGMLDALIMPPKEFDHDYTGRMTIMRGDLDAIVHQCQGKTLTGCAYRMTAETCFIWIVNDDILRRQGYTYDVVYRHERAHWNGRHHGKAGVTCWANSCQ